MMQGSSRFMDDVAQLVTNAMGVAQGAREEAETAVRSRIDRWLADREFVGREEFDAVRAMAQKAREENDALKARVAVLEQALLRAGLIDEAMLEATAARADPAAADDAAGEDAKQDEGVAGADEDAASGSEPATGKAR